MSTSPPHFAFTLGLGYSGRAILQELKGKGFRVGGTTRSADKQVDLRKQGIEAVDFPTTVEDLPEGITHLIISLPPGQDGSDAGLELLKGKTLPNSITWVGYLSATSVYGDHKGQWVTEKAALKGTSPRATSRIKAEQGWQAHGAEVFRLAGIYGPGRSVFDRLRAGKAQRITGSGILFSRIHVDDIAGAVAHAIAQPEPRRVLNLADNEPAPSADLVEAGARLSGLPLPPATSLEDAELSEMGRSFYADSKRVRNSKLTRELGYKLRHPTWREGLDSIWKAERKTPPRP
ncbi:MAG: SDR family oxidoreductase [Alphaproteobacteria bacterium]